MFHHVVLFKLRAGVTLDRVRGAREALGALVETLPGVDHFAVTHNVAEHHGGFSMVLFSVFESPEAFAIFSRHPEFRRVWEEELLPVIDEHMVAQGPPLPGTGAADL